MTLTDPFQTLSSCLNPSIHSLYLISHYRTLLGSIPSFQDPQKTLDSPQFTLVPPASPLLPQIIPKPQGLIQSFPRRQPSLLEPLQDPQTRLGLVQAPLLPRSPSGAPQSSLCYPTPSALVSAAPDHPRLPSNILLASQHRFRGPVSDQSPLEHMGTSQPPGQANYGHPW